MSRFAMFVFFAIISTLTTSCGLIVRITPTNQGEEVYRPAPYYPQATQAWRPYRLNGRMVPAATPVSVYKRGWVQPPVYRQPAIRQAQRPVIRPAAAQRQAPPPQVVAPPRKRPPQPFRLNGRMVPANGGRPSPR